MRVGDAAWSIWRAVRDGEHPEGPGGVDKRPLRGVGVSEERQRGGGHGAAGVPGHRHRHHHGRARALQVDLRLLPGLTDCVWVQRLKLKYAEALSKFAFSFNLRRYIMGKKGQRVWTEVGRCRLTL